MMIRNAILFTILATSFMIFLPTVYAEPTVNIIMDKTTYKYCEKLFYIIEVSEISGDPAIIHIRDETGKGSSAIPIEISKLQNPIPSIIAFEKNIFPLGKYFVDVEYSGSEFTAEFNLIDSDNICIPQSVKLFLVEWYNGKILDGFLIDSIQKNVDPKLIEIPFEINEDNIYDISIPNWTKNVVLWWGQGFISDNEFAQVINYLIDKNLILPQIQIENEI
ncbi:MAG: hypothetical protein HRU07_05350 [Nitrosopumilus sp.]|nr:hypothetical protein [Nitrosopumilus sp.]NRA05574.1 hypothetical protein [Nitrosopumilus sp.]